MFSSLRWFLCIPFMPVIHIAGAQNHETLLINSIKEKNPILFDRLLDNPTIQYEISRPQDEDFLFAVSTQYGNTSTDNEKEILQHMAVELLLKGIPIMRQWYNSIQINFLNRAYHNVRTRLIENLLETSLGKNIPPELSALCIDFLYPNN